jgi:hypothetical protein
VDDATDEELRRNLKPTVLALLLPSGEVDFKVEETSDGKVSVSVTPFQF